MKEHHYHAKITWTGNLGEGTSAYRYYSRNHTISINNKAEILGSSDPAFFGDKTLHNPEEMLVSALSACHMLWYLHLCSDRQIIVTAYIDYATGTMIETPDEGGMFKEVILNPIVTIVDSNQIDLANTLHDEAHKKCFIANSCNFPVLHVPICITEDN